MRSIVLRGLSTGAAMSSAVLGTMMVSSAIERRSPWSGPNAMSTVLYPRKVSDRPGEQTLIGASVLIGGLLLWGIGYEAALRVAQRRPAIVGGLLAGLFGYAFDKLVLPDKVLSSFRSKMGLAGTVAKYSALAGAAMLMTRRRGRIAPESVPLGGEKLLVTSPRATLPWGSVLGSA